MNEVAMNGNVMTGRAADGRSHLVRAMSELDAAYDYKAQCYSGAHTDESIAKALALSPVFVAKVRAEHFGPAHKPKPKTDAERIAALEATVAELSASVAALMDAATKPVVAKPSAIVTGETTCQEAIIAAMTGKGWMQSCEIVSAVGWPGKANTIYSTLNKMRGRGLVESKPSTFSKFTGGKVANEWRLK